MDVHVRLGGDGVDDAERAELARGLQAVLRDLDDVDAAEQVTGGAVPAGSKSGGVVTWGALVVSLASVGSFQVVVDVIASWLRRQPVDVDVEIDGHKLSGTVTRTQRDALVAAFLAHTDSAAPRPAEP